MPQNFLQLLYTVHHREQDADRTIAGCPIDCPQLGLKHLRRGKADADRAKSEGWVHLRFVFRQLGQLACAKVQRADDRPFSLHLADDLAIGAHLLLLAGQSIPFQVKEFAAHQSQSVRITADDLLDVQRLGDAGKNFHLSTVNGAVGFSNQMIKSL